MFLSRLFHRGRAQSIKNNVTLSPDNNNNNGAIIDHEEKKRDLLSAMTHFLADIGAESLDTDVEVTVPMALEISSPSGANTPVKRKVRKNQICHTLEASEVLRLEEFEVKKLVEAYSVPADVAWASCERLGWKMDEIKSQLKEAAHKRKSTTPKQLQPQQPQPQQQHSCQICGNDVAWDRTMKLTLCPESHRYCLDCWGSYAATTVKDGKLPVPCLAVQCENRLADVAVLRELLNKETFDLCQYLSCTNYMSKNGKMRWCTSPFCNKALQLNPAHTLDTKARCSCGTPFCGACGGEWHAPIDCQTYKEWCERNVADGESTKWLTIFTRPCPNPECKRPIEKNGGCPHMHCKACDQHFCWSCMKLYVNGSHPGSCPGETYNHGVNPTHVAEFRFFQQAHYGYDVCATKDATVTTLLEVAERKASKAKKGAGAALFEDAVWVFLDHLRILRFSYVLIYSAQIKKDKYSTSIEFMTELQTDLLRALGALKGLLMDESDDPEHKDRLKEATKLAVEKGKALGVVGKEELSSALWKKKEAAAH